ncbi:MAG: PAS domain S-box protein [Syntrophorhabdales bacterium]|jgi:PAS domain S-box-containing protein
MTLKVKIIAGYLLLNAAALLMALILIHDCAKATGSCDEAVARNLLILIGLVNFATTIILAVASLRRIRMGLNRMIETLGSISGVRSSRIFPAWDDGDRAGFLGKASQRMAEKLEEIVRETKQSEEKYSTLLDNASDAILIIEDRKFVFANKTFLRIMGYTKEELIGTDYLHIVAPESVELLRERYTKRLRGLDVPTITEARFIDRYGEGHYFEVNAGLVERSDGKAVLVILRDFMESKEYETSLKKLSRQVLTTQEEERRRISRELHDEIGQALSAMNISIEILLRNGVQHDFREKRLRDVKNLIEKIVTKDLDGMVSLSSRLFGFGVKDTFRVPEQGFRSTLIGKGDAFVELIEPLGPDTPMARFLGAKESVLHHFSLLVDSIDAESEALKSMGPEW